jgi:transcriptional regulator with XRE-family HTH domain
MSPAQFKEIREKLGLTQVELSQVLGLSGRKPISHFETGFRTPSPLIQALMSLLNGLSERKAAEFIELLNEHMVRVLKDKRRSANARG